MSLLTDNELAIFNNLINISQDSLYNVMQQYLSRMYKEPLMITEHYILAQGDIPIALCAHLDTVFMDNNNKTLIYDRAKELLLCPEGAGFDDRAGIFAILNIVKSGLRPHIILCRDEEIGGIGASALGNTTNPFPELRYIIELDRAHKNDCVFYDDDDIDFEEYIEGFGFELAYGSFSDISFIAPKWNVGAVNLSIGYYHEHTTHEYLDLRSLFTTINKVKKMLCATNIPTFTFHECEWIADFTDNKIYTICNYCNKLKQSVTTLKVLTPTGFITVCSDCITYPEIVWCQHCSLPFVSLNKTYQKIGVGICPKCQKEN